jgi:hypothetical protein
VDFVGDVLSDGKLALFGVPLLVALILILVAGRNENDANRTQARYLGTLVVALVFVTLFAVFGTVRALSDLIVDKEAPAQSSSKLPGQLQDLLDQLAPKGGAGLLGGSHDDSGPALLGSDDADYRTAMQTGLLALAAGGVLVFHLRRSKNLVPSGRAAAASGGTTRVIRAAAYGACFVAALIAIVASVDAVYGLFKIAAPGVVGGGDADSVRQAGISDFISFLLLAAGAVWVFLHAWNRVPEHK